MVQTIFSFFFFFFRFKINSRSGYNSVRLMGANVGVLINSVMGSMIGGRSILFFYNSILIIKLKFVNVRNVRKLIFNRDYHKWCKLLLD